MKKTIIAIAAAGFLGGTAVTMTATPAAAVYPIFLFAAKADPNFKSVNPYDTKPAARAHKRAKHKKR